jgi:hypothetical protein
MKKQFYSAISILLLSVSSLTAQSDITSIFKAGAADLNTVANGYLSPAGTAFATGLGSNWYNTADVHSVFGFDVTMGAGVVQIPTADQTFSLSGLKALQPSVAGTTQAPTFGGSGNGVGLNLMLPVPQADGTTKSTVITSFNTPNGVFNYVPTASLQVTVGLPFINDVTVRFMPKVTAGGFETSMWGLGIKHDIKKYIPVVSLLPFDAAVMVDYTKMNINYGFASPIKPEMLVGSSFALDPYTTTYAGQGMNIDASAMNASLLISKKLLFLTPYLGLGITRTNFDLTMTGNYPVLGNPKSQVIAGKTVPVLDPISHKPIMNINNMTDPIKISASELMPSATVGLRVKILFLLTAHVQYTMQKYPVASAGFGFTFR